MLLETRKDNVKPTTVIGIQPIMFRQVNAKSLEGLFKAYSRFKDLDSRDDLD
jgi:hypothetical protein